MKNNPELTAYALDELTEEEKNILFEKLKAEGFSEEEIETEANEIKKVTNALKEEFAKDENLRLSLEQREVVFPKHKLSWKKWFLPLEVTALLVVTVVIGVKFNDKLQNELNNNVDFVIGEVDSKVNESFSDASFAPNQDYKAVVKHFENRKRQELKNKESYAPVRLSRSKGKVAKKIGMPSTSSVDEVAYDMAMESEVIAPIPMPSKVIMPKDKTEKFNREGYEKIDVNPYVLVSNQPLSTFSVDVDTASYANMRRFLFKGQLPPKDSIRVEELVNYFPYDYKMDFDKHPVAIKVDQSVSPWNKNRKLVRVAMKSDSPSDLINANKNLVFLLDVSGSMNDPKKLPLLKESMKLLVRKLKPEDTISLVVYAGAAGVVLEPTQIKDKLKIFKAMDNLSAGGSTNGGAGIKAAYKMAKQNFIKNGVNRVIIATDGDFNVGTSSQSALIDLIEEKAKEDIFLTVVGLGMGNYQDAMLEKISNRGNGNYAYIDSLSEANKLFNVDLEKNLTTVAKDVKVQIEFNPNKVQAYRLIGYENRMLKAQDFNNDKKDAGEMGAGHTVTALYEIVLPEEKMDNAKIDKLKYQKKAKVQSSDELLTVKVRYKKPTEDKSTKFEVALNDSKKEFKAMDKSFRFATTVASFGMKLRGDKLVQDLSYRDLEKMAKEAKSNDPYDFEEEFIELIDLAKQIDK